MQYFPALDMTWIDKKTLKWRALQWK